MKIALTAKFRHGALVEVLAEKGWNQSDLARACGVSASVVSLWMQMRDMPRNPEVRARVEQATGRLIEDLFPPELERLVKQPLPREVTVIRDMEVESLLTATRRQALMDPATVVEETAVLEALTATLKGLSPKEEVILRAHFGLGETEPRTLHELGALYGVSAERIRGIEQQALKKLQQPRYHRRLLAALDLHEAPPLPERLPCPQCGGQRTWVSLAGDGYVIACYGSLTCGFRGPRAANRREAANAWNRLPREDVRA